MHCGEEAASEEKGSAVLVPPSTVQSLRNIGPGPLEFLVVVEPAWRKDDEVIVGGNRE